MDKYRNKYRIPSARAQWWNYGWDAAYFVTIVTRNRKCVFGDISDVMDADEYDRIAKYIVNNPAQWAADKFFGF